MLYPGAIQPNSIPYRIHSLSPHIHFITYHKYVRNFHSFPLNSSSFPALLSSHLLFLYSTQALITTDINGQSLNRPTYRSQWKGEVLVLPHLYLNQGWVLLAMKYFHNCKGPILSSVVLLWDFLKQLHPAFKFTPCISHKKQASPSVL